MSLDLSPQAESILEMEAAREGVSIDALIVRTFSKPVVSIKGERHSLPQAHETTGQKRRSVLGKYAFVPGGSEEFAREKQGEILREDTAQS